MLSLFRIMTQQTGSIYNVRLSAGLGLLDETRSLLDLWEPGISPSTLHEVALASGRFPTITSRRLLNIVKDCFAPRYLVNGGKPAAQLKNLMNLMPTSELNQFYLLFTCRANAILNDFIREIYWERYASGFAEISNFDAEKFVRRAIDDGKTQKRWAEKTIKNVAGYLTGCCADYGLLEKGHKTVRRILPFLISPSMAGYLAYDLHFAGLGDNAVLSHSDWLIFGLAVYDVREELKRLALKGYLILQSAGDITRISWKYKTMEELCDVLAKG
ncbi:MAG: BrxA family protein [Deltaproteobacteria bacterium]